MKNLIKKAAVSLSTVGATLVALPARAVGDFTEKLGDVGTAAYGGEPANDIFEIIGLVLNAVMGLLGVVLLILILYGGFLWMTAGGNSEQVTKARSIIINSVIGLIIIMAAYAISTFVFGAILTSTGAAA